MAEKTFHSITLPGQDTARVPLTAAEFSTSVAYQVKDYCTYQGKLYRCTIAHAAGAWNAAHFTATDVDAEFDRKLDIPASQATAPANPRVGDLWIDNDENSPIYNVDASPTLNSTNAVQSGGTKVALNSLDSRKMEHGVITGDFSASVDYRVGDLVFYATTANGITTRTLYRCSTDHNATAWNAAHFTATTLEVELQRIRESEADTDMIGDLFGAKSTYVVGDYCVYNDNLYRCIQAVDNTGVTTPAFDPDDWTQVALANEVNDLKSAINTIDDDINKLNVIFWTKKADKGINYSDGSEVSSSVFGCTDFINVSIFKTIEYKRVNVTGPATTGLAFYKKDGSYDSGISSATYQSEVGYALFTVNVPDTAYYARFTFLKDAATYGNFEAKGLSKIKDEISSIESEIDDLNNVLTQNFANDTILTDYLNIEKNIDLKWVKATDKGIQYNDGAEIVSSIFACTEPIYIGAFISITYKRVNVIGGANTGIAFYDKKMQYISGVVNNQNQSTTGYSLYTVDVPQGAEYVRCTYLKDASTYGDFSILGTLNNLFDILFNITNEFVKGDEKINLPFTLSNSLGSVNYSDGTIITSSIFRPTSFVNVSHYDSIGYKRINTKLPLTTVNYGIAFYDKDKVYISGKASLDGSVSLGYTFDAVDVPVNAVYAKFTTINDTSTYGDFEYYLFNKIVTKQNENTSSINSIKEVINLNDAVSINTIIDINKGSINYSDGTIITSSIFKPTEYINISGFKKLYYKQIASGLSSPDYGMAFYDEEKTFLVGAGALPNRNPHGYKSGTISVPTDAVYARFTTWNDTETYGDFTLFGESILYNAIQNSGGGGITYPSLSSIEKQELLNLADEYYQARSIFWYDGAERDSYSSASCIITKNNVKYFDCVCSMFAQFIWMGRDISDFNIDNYSPTITKAFNWGYYFDFINAKRVYGVKKPDNSRYGISGDGKYSYNSFGESAATQQNQFSMTAAEMAEELYNLGCEIPRSAVEVGDLVFYRAPTEYANTVSMQMRFRNIRHVAVVIDPNYLNSGHIKTIECVPENPCFVKQSIMDSNPQRCLRASFYDHTIVMFARHPHAWGKASNVPSKITAVKGTNLVSN